MDAWNCFLGAWSNFPGGNTGAESAVYNCLVVQVVISHLKQQLTDSRVNSERMAAVERTNSSLGQVQRLTEELHEAKSAHTPVCTSHNTVDSLYAPWVLQKIAQFSVHCTDAYR